MHLKAAALAGAAIVLAGCGGSSENAVPTITSKVEVTKTLTVTVPPSPSAPKAIMETDGMYRVGIDIEPGTYRTDGKSPEAMDCYWARLRSLNENDIIASDMGTGPQLVLIEASDRAFYTHRCQTWLKQ
ncbi:MAG: hypothetical protein KDB72_19360 [Mycobacterium sp.]|nr:hypothetical protein [Mycobacterium sp.]